MLKNAVTSRFASNMVFMSLLLGAEISVLFSPSRPAQYFRQALEESQYFAVYFWAGIFLCISIGLTLSTLLANFTAWAIIGAVSSENSHAVLRSSIGLYAAQLPARLAVLSVYCFVIWVILFIFEIMPFIWGICMAAFIFLMVAHIVVVYSAFGRLVIYSKAMRKTQIFDGDEEDSMTSKRLFEELLNRAVEEKAENTPLPLYYRQHSEIREQVTKLIERVSDHADSGIGEVNYPNNLSHSHHLSKIMFSKSAREEFNEGNGEASVRFDLPRVDSGAELVSMVKELSQNLNKILQTPAAERLSEDVADEESPKLEVSCIGSEASDINTFVSGLESILDKSNLTNSLNSAPTVPRRKHKRESSGVLLQRNTPQSPVF